MRVWFQKTHLLFQSFPYRQRHVINFQDPRLNYDFPQTSADIAKFSVNLWLFQTNLLSFEWHQGVALIIAWHGHRSRSHMFSCEGMLHDFILFDCTLPFRENNNTHTHVATQERHNNYSIYFDTCESRLMTTTLFAGLKAGLFLAQTCDKKMCKFSYQFSSNKISFSDANGHLN